MSGLTRYLRSRLTANASRVAGKAAAYAAALVAVIFCLAALFVWIAQTESLVVACLIFAAIFAGLAIAAVVVVSVQGRRAEELRQNQPATLAAMLANNPPAVLMGLRAVNVLRRNAPVGAVGAAAAIGLILVFLNARRGT